jgi:hypothetical protein
MAAHIVAIYLILIRITGLAHRVSRINPLFQSGGDMARYEKKTQETVKEAMEKFKKGELKSGKSGKTVKSREQAIAIGLSEAREKGAKVPPVSKKARKG